MATATSLTTQNPTARRRWAWCSPATGANTWARSPAATASRAAMVAPATSRAASSMPGNGRLSPTSPNRVASPGSVGAGPEAEKRASASR